MFHAKELHHGEQDGKTKDLLPNLGKSLQLRMELEKPGIRWGRLPTIPIRSVMQQLPPELREERNDVCTEMQ
ncbi:hypothetical protein ACTXT7_014597 [Hymenolepis weldensis]